MYLYKINVENTEFCYEVFTDFAIVAESEDMAIKLAQERGEYNNGWHDYLDVSKLKIEKVAEVANIKTGYENCIISCNYINS